MKIKSTYHNEMIGMLALNEVLNCVETLSLAQSMLVLPFLFHKETVEYLSNTNIDSIDSFIGKKGRLLANLNARYYSLLPISVNAILLGKSLDNFTVFDSTLMGLNQIDMNYDFGRRHKYFRKASPTLASIITSVEPNVIYSKLKITI